MNYYRELPGSDPRLVGIPPSLSLAWHSEGWKAAAELLEAAYKGENVNRGKYLPYALAGIWRHAIELQAKEVLYLAEDLGYGKAIWNTHNLSEIAAEVLKVLQRAHWTDSFVASWEEVLKEIREWESSDPNGEMLRYPLNNAGKPHRWPKQAVDFSRTITCCRRTSELLAAIRIGIEEELFPDDG